MHLGLDWGSCRRQIGGPVQDRAAAQAGGSIAGFTDGRFGGRAVLSAWAPASPGLDQAGMLAGGKVAAIAAAELVHRGIKHVGIMLSGGQVKVPGFGIAWAEGATAVTGTLAVLGTAACLSPEQAPPADRARRRTCTLTALGAALGAG